ncbi:MAG: preprotein translocase subunit SecG [Bacteriovoracaceae bacterium]|jgi:preprotein translocase subunit SecG|nr:preprotein translocase subunit SecG [Bacteriovoracaceae bacterium]
MATALMVLQAIVAVLLIISVLLQFGKGAEAGLLTQAGSETVMSNSTRGNIMTKITAVLAVIFLVNSILLARTQDSKFNKSLLDTEAPVARPLNNDAAEAAAQPATTPAATTTAPTTEAVAPTTTAPATTPAAGTTTTK